MPLRRPTSDTQELMAAAVAGLRAIYREGFRFAKAGAMLVDLVTDTVAQGELDLTDTDTPASLQSPADGLGLMKSIDSLNKRYGRGAVGVTNTGVARRIGVKDWQMRQERHTPEYTTRFADIATARA